MSTLAKKYGILVAVDGSPPESDAAVSWAAHEAALRHTEVTIMHVIAPMIVTWPITTAQLEIAEWQNGGASQQILEQAEKTFHASVTESNAPAVRTESVPSPVISTLIDNSEEAAMMVVGIRGAGKHGRLTIGSVSNALLHHAHCPVVVVHPEDRTDPTAPVVVGIDGSPASESATGLAFEEAHCVGGWIWWPCMRGAIPRSSPPSRWTGTSMRSRRMRRSPSASPVGRSGIRTSMSTADCRATGPRIGWPPSRRKRSSWSSVAAGAAASPGCCWAR